MAKQVQIDQKLFTELVRYHCLGVHDDAEMNEHIERELSDKLDRMCKRIEYTNSLTLKEKTGP